MPVMIPVGMHMNPSIQNHVSVEKCIMETPAIKSATAERRYDKRVLSFARRVRSIASSSRKIRLSAQNFEYSDFFISFSFRTTFSPGTALIIVCSLSRLVFRSDTFMDTRYDNRATFAIHFIVTASA